MSRLPEQLEEGHVERRHSTRRRSDVSAAQILESITDEFVFLDREWRFTYINETGLNSIRRAKGQELTREDLLGKNLWELFPELVSSIYYRKYHEAMREQKTVEVEGYSPLTARWLEVHVYPSEEGLSIYAHDITERKEAEEKSPTTPTCWRTYTTQS